MVSTSFDRFPVVHRLKEEDVVSYAWGSGAWCNCCNLIFALLMACSPYYLWVPNYVVSPGLQTSTLAVGSFWVSTSTSPLQISNGALLTAQSNIWTDFGSSEVCDTNSDVFVRWAQRYNYCDESGTFSTPTGVMALQVFSVLTPVFLVLSCCSGPFVDKKPFCTLCFMASCTFVACISALAAFSLVLSETWYFDLLDPKGAPLALRDNSGSLQIIQTRAFLGPSWGGAVVVFISTLFASCSLCSVARNVRMGTFKESSKASGSKTVYEDDNTPNNTDLEKENTVGRT